MALPDPSQAAPTDAPRLHDPVQVQVLELGFALSGQSLHLLGAAPHQPATTTFSHSCEELVPYLHSFSERITAAIDGLILNARERIETGHLEELQYRARSLVLLLYGNKQPEARRYSAMLAESVALLRRRQSEARWKWLGLALAAQALLALAQAACDEVPTALVNELRTTDEQARRDLLDLLVPFLNTGYVPWAHLAEFFYGKDNQLLTWALAATQRATAAHLRPTPPSRAMIREALTLLEPCHNLYFEDRIPEKKLYNARTACAVDPAEELVALLDCTVFGSAKDAVLFGTTNLYFYNSVGTGVQPGRLSYRELDQRQLSAKGNCVDLGHGLCCFIVGSAVSAEQLLHVLERLGGRGRSQNVAHS